MDKTQWNNLNCTQLLSSNYINQISLQFVCYTVFATRYFRIRSLPILIYHDKDEREVYIYSEISKNFLKNELEIFFLMIKCDKSVNFIRRIVFLNEFCNYEKCHGNLQIQVKSKHVGK